MHNVLQKVLKSIANYYNKSVLEFLWLLSYFSFIIHPKTESNNITEKNTDLIFIIGPCIYVSIINYYQSKTITLYTNNETSCRTLNHRIQHQNAVILREQSKRLTLINY